MPAICSVTDSGKIFGDSAAETVSQYVLTGGNVMKKKLLAMVMCLTMVFGLAGCGGGGDAKDGADAAGSADAGNSTVVVAIGAGFSTLDPGYVYEKYPPVVVNACYENLFKFYTNDGAPEPCLADSYEFSEDNLTLTVKLRRMSLLPAATR